MFAKREFVIPASPAAKAHFEEMERGGEGVGGRWLNAKRQSTPVIYEDAEKTKVMKVNAPVRLRFLSAR